MRAALVAFAVWSASADDCASFTDCIDCAGDHGCGWCSVPVQFADGTKGPQCASPAGGKTFTCPGVYSTDSCVEGWTCDQATGTCRQALPGQGVKRDQCESSCTAGPAKDVYGCKNGTKICKIVPPGTPGSADRDSCNAHCFTPAVKVYKCDAKTKKCAEVPAGTAGSSSKEVCEARGCDTGVWKCDPDTLKCVEGGGKKSENLCEADCREQNDPCQFKYTCQDCLATGPECGWCSTNVTYANGRNGTQCAGVRKDILPFQCPGDYSNHNCTTPPSPPAPTPPSPSPPGPSPLPPKVNCPKGSTVLLQYSCTDKNCSNCDFVAGKAKECLEPYCTLFCSGECNSVPAFGTSYMWTCNDIGGKGWTNATLVHYTKFPDCTGPTNPAGSYGGGTFPLDTCNGIGPNVPPQYNTFRCVPCGDACDGP